MHGAGAAGARGAVARGQALFNGTPIAIRGVKGINDDLGLDTLPPAEKADLVAFLRTL